MSCRWAWLMLAGWWLLIAGPLLWEPGNLFQGDTGWLDVPNRLHAASQLRDGVFPVWTSLLLTGFPLHGEGQTGVLYPGFVVYLFSPTPAAHDIFCALHLALAGVFMYMFLRRFRGSRLPAVLGAMLWVVSVSIPYTVPGILVTLSWLPLAAWCVFRWAEGESRAVWWCAAVNGLMLFAGSPNTALVCFTIELLLLVAVSLEQQRWKRLGGSISVVLVAPAALAAAQLLPTFAYFLASNRANANVRQLVSEDHIPAGNLIPLLVVWSLPAIVWSRPRRRPLAWFALALLGALIGVASPLIELLYMVPVYSWFRWPHEFLWMTAFAACALFTLATEEAWGARRLLRSKRTDRAFVAVTILLLVWLGDWLSLRHQLSTQDFFSSEVPADLRSDAGSHLRILQRRNAYYGLPDMEPPGGLDSPALEAAMRRNRSFLPANYNLIHGIAGADLANLPRTVSPREGSEIWSIIEEAVHPNLLRVAAITHLAGPEPLWLYRSASMAGDGWRFKSLDVGARARAVPNELGAVRVEIEHITDSEKWKIQLQQLFLPLRGDSVYNVSFRARAENTRSIGVGLSRTYAPWHSLGLYREVELTTELQDFEIESLIETDEPNGRLHFNVGGDSADVEIDKVQVRGPDGDRVGMLVPSWGDSLELVADAPAWIYRMRDPPPRAWMVYDAILLPNSTERLEMLVDSAFDPERQAITESRVELGEQPGRAPQVTTREPRPDRLEVEVETDGRGLLVVADLFDRGFVATLDGHRAELLRVNHAFRGIIVPAGRHLVEMAYRSRELYLGLVVSLVSWVVVVFASVRKRKGP